MQPLTLCLFPQINHAEAKIPLAYERNKVHIGLVKQSNSSNSQTGYTVMIVYQGPSMLDGSPIVMIVTGFKGSSNRKTGAELLQTYILRDDMHPVEASRTGADKAICGDCKHQGQRDEAGARIEGSRECYVNLGQGVSVVYKSHARDHYETCAIEDLASTFDGKLIRLGTYGDPAAVPMYVWELMLSRSAGRTGYTHQWRDPGAFWLKAYVMASVDTLEEAAEAQTMGWRTFRVAPAVGWTKEAGESLCPASEEGGKATTCDHCRLCSGTEGKGKGKGNIVIPNHSTQPRAVKRRGGVTFKKNGVAA
jgi:hypothetical protein